MLLGNYVDGVKATGFPIGDTVVAQECDASVSVPSTVSTHCDAATQISGNGGNQRHSGGFSSHRRDPPGRKRLLGQRCWDLRYRGSCDIVVTDSGNSAYGSSTAVGFATPIVTVKKTTAVIGTT